MPDDRWYDLAERPWVPVRFRASLTPDETAELAALAPGTTPGQAARHGLRTVLTAAHLIESLECPNPAAESALTRVLIALAARVTGLDREISDDGTPWAEHRWSILETGRFTPAAITTYLDTHHDRLYLYHPDTPWMQDPRLRAECTGSSGIGRLSMTLPSGNNHLWWPLPKDGSGSPLPAEDAALDLLVWRYYGPSGMAANRQHGTMPKATKTTVAGPMRCTISWFPAGQSLFESLTISIPAPDTWPTTPGPDLAPWETPELPNPLLPKAPTGPVSLLTARHAHAVLLQPDTDDTHATDSWVTWAWQGDIPNALDPYLIHRDQGGPVRANSSRAAWRDLDALLLKTRPGVTSTASRPPVLNAINDLPMDVADRLRLRSYGIHQDKQDTNTAWTQSVTPPVLGHLEERDPDGAAAISAARAQAEAVASGLGRALRQAWASYASGSSTCPWTETATTEYWTESEAEFWAVVTAAGADRPRPRFQAIATTIYDRTTAEASHTARGMSAIETARATMLRPPRKTAKKTKAP
ncbi:type I-E CRISPR-associated protein Cse1/CasA [Streptomyces broussonetiae]|uniref:Type I-E CRISPR-associated protein Cse1/CasA n=1 Tax=Streptomyces broussonetiae TaxID=2686304 RepID=A0A6I6MV72_9ACTN|nr:type I-E CRISPR-associated protein Cse1/CasA [Streptomyces broussonetiae]QHA04608.1 type I-E CRISPR-associated protein Cse1/CasA [Streptomyces broussonetiae]